jgi:hypothetical protein
VPTVQRNDRTSFGIEHPHILDAIAQDPETERVDLIMWEHRMWEGSDERLFQLQEKLNAYLSFALDGEMEEAYPGFTNKKLRLLINCSAVPDERTAQFLAYVREQIALQDIDLEVHVIEEAHGSCPDCGCSNQDQDASA